MTDTFESGTANLAEVLAEDCASIGRRSKRRSGSEWGREDHRPVTSPLHRLLDAGHGLCEGTEMLPWVSDRRGHYQEQDLLKQICQHCPIQAECRAFAIEMDVDGFWAGTTRRQREEMGHKRPSRSYRTRAS